MCKCVLFLGFFHSSRASNVTFKKRKKKNISGHFNHICNIIVDKNLDLFNANSLLNLIQVRKPCPFYFCYLPQKSFFFFLHTQGAIVIIMGCITFSWAEVWRWQHWFYLSFLTITLSLFAEKEKHSSAVIYFFLIDDSWTFPAITLTLKTLNLFLHLNFSQESYRWQCMSCHRCVFSFLSPQGASVWDLSVSLTWWTKLGSEGWNRNGQFTSADSLQNSECCNHTCIYQRLKRNRSCIIYDY